jgi:hypothetical protein
MKKGKKNVRMIMISYAMDHEERMISDEDVAKTQVAAAKIMSGIRAANSATQRDASDRGRG